MILLNSNDRLILRFDELDADFYSYQYKFIHCNSLWETDNLSEMEYIDGFNELNIDYYKNSFNTTQAYVHYMIEFPNEDINFLKVRLKNLIKFHNIFLKNLSKTKISFNKTFKFLQSIKKKLLSYSVDLNELVNSKKFLNKKLLFEGAQGLMLDIDYGTFPYVTSSNTLPANAASSIGLNHKKLGHILGIVKAYTTRVGEGPFPTEVKSQLGLDLAKNGNEFGSVTGRPRRLPGGFLNLAWDVSEPLRPLGLRM